MLVWNPSNENRRLEKFSGKSNAAPVLYLAEIGSMIMTAGFILVRVLLWPRPEVLCSQNVMEKKEYCQVYSLIWWSAPAVKIQGCVGWNWQSNTPETDTRKEKQWHDMNRWREMTELYYKMESTVLHRDPSKETNCKKYCSSLTATGDMKIKEDRDSTTE